MTRYQRALLDQPQVSILPAEYATIVPAVLFALGQLFVVTSTWQLGITGTFLGDYFGILMDARVEGYVDTTCSNRTREKVLILRFRFPFNVLRDPMYVGSTMCFIATALWYERPAGLLVSVYVYIVYLIALRFEGCVHSAFLVRVSLLTRCLFVLQALDRYDLRQPRCRAEEGCRQVFVDALPAIECN